MPKNIADSCNAFVAVLADAAAAFCAVYIAIWVRFDGGWFDVKFGRPEDVYVEYVPIGIAAMVIVYATFRWLRLYKRPQRGTYPGKIPRLLRGAVTTTIAMLVISALIKNYYAVSVGVILLFLPCFIVLVLIERALLFRLEIVAAKNAPAENSILIIGTDSTAAHLMRCFSRDARLRVKVSGVLKVTAGEKTDATIPAANIMGELDNFIDILGEMPNITQVIITNPDIPRRKLAEIALECERRLIRFNIVPDMFLVMTSSVEVETVDDIPLLGLKRSPLDKLSNKFAKRAEDIAGALIGLIFSAPIIFVMAILIKRESPGPVFYSQERCGYGGKPFKMYKLRSMKQNAEAETGAVFAEKDDPRCTKIGAWMRSRNVDELPQFWNVLKGNMSLVGPRPERPAFVEQFTTEINHYMRRHVCRPGITGWAQVHCLRGNTSIEERLRLDLWYLENWSLALDLKILLRTCFAVKNAY